MRVKIIKIKKEFKHGVLLSKVGDVCKVTRDFGKELIKEGCAVETEEEAGLSAAEILALVNNEPIVKEPAKEKKKSKRKSEKRAD